MSAQLSLPGVKWPPPPRPPPRSLEKRLPRPIAPILGSPPAIKQQRGMCGRAREFVREIWKSATLNAAELRRPVLPGSITVPALLVLFWREWADLRYKVLQEENSAKFGEGYRLAGFGRIWPHPHPHVAVWKAYCPAINNKTRLNSISYDRMASRKHAARLSPFNLIGILLRVDAINPRKSEGNHANARPRHHGYC